MTANNHRSRPTQPGAPALIEHDTLKFLIVNNPAQATLPQFVKVSFVCVCEPTKGFRLASVVCVCVCEPTKGFRLASVVCV